jgi:dTDP-glucose 4,6-dehydratase
MLKLVITGCRGFIGSNFLIQFLKDFEKHTKPFDGILLIDAGYLEGLGDMPEWNMDGNLKIYNELKNQCVRCVKTFDEYSVDINHIGDHFVNLDDDVKYVVINFASESHVDNSISTPFAVYKDNSTLVPNLIEWLGLNNIEEFIHIRTDEEYGHLISKDNEPFKVGDPIKPRNPYSASKASQTLFLQSLETTFNLRVQYITLANQFGKHQHFSKMIPTTIKSIMDGKDALIFGKGTQLREWTYVEDTCTIILDHLINGNGQHVHISNIEGLVTNIDLVKLIIKILKEEHDISGEWILGADRQGHDFCYKIQPTEFFKHTTLVDGLKETIKHYVELYEK